jgi:integrase/recombinase XerD
MTPQEAITRVLAYWRLTRYSPGTVQLYGEQLQRFAAWLAAQAIDDLRKVTHAHVAAYQMQLRQSTLGRETQAVRLRAVKRLYQHLTDEGCLLLDPTEGLQEVSRRQPLPRSVLSLREMKRLLAAPDTTTPQGIRDRALLEVLYATGVRIGELMKARKDDVQAATQTLHIRHAKGGTPRVVPLGAQATQWLVAYLEQVRPPMVTARPFEAALFVARGGSALGIAQVRNLLRQYRKAAGIKKTITPHLLRHSCATHLMQAGAPLRVIQELLGHRRLTSTVFYTRVMPLDVKATHARFHPGSDDHAVD